MSPVGFEPTISVSERPQTDALDRAATGTGTQTRYTFATFACCKFTYVFFSTFVLKALDDGSEGPKHVAVYHMA